MAAGRESGVVHVYDSKSSIPRLTNSDPTEQKIPGPVLRTGPLIYNVCNSASNG